jgi:hypothetical protein
MTIEDVSFGHRRASVVLGASEWPTLDRVLRGAGFH